MAKQRIVTLLTDFGWSDPYVAEMKGVVLSVSPDATLVDISHDIPAGDVLAAAFVLRQALPYFPPETVHCVVVDPGVGTERRILAARYAGQSLVFPDNGVITFVERDQPPEALAVVRNDRYFLQPSISATFHGRDIMAPVAAHLANGLAISRLGPHPERFQVLELPEPSQAEDGSVVGQVMYTDRFGNLISNIPVDVIRDSLGGLTGVEVACGGRPVGPIRTAYAEADIQQPLALINSMSLLEVAVNGGRACDNLGAGTGAEVRVTRAPGRG